MAKKHERKHSTLLTFKVLKGLREQSRYPFVKYKEAVGADGKHVMLKLWLEAENPVHIKLFESDLAHYLSFNSLPTRPRGVPKLLEHGEAIYERKRTEDEKVKYMVFELPKYGKLRTLINSIKAEEGLALAQSFLLTLQSLHGQRLVLTHLNINTLFVGEGLEVLVFDYYLASELTLGPLELPLESKYYCEDYFPPEYKERTFESRLFADVFMAGLLTFNLLYKATPFKKSACKEDVYYGKLMEGKYAQFWKEAPFSQSEVLSQAQKSILLFMLYPDPDLRINLEGALGSALFDKVDAKASENRIQTLHSPICEALEKARKKRKDKKVRQEFNTKICVFSHPSKLYRDGLADEKFSGYSAREFMGTQLDLSRHVVLGVPPEEAFLLLKEKILPSRFNRFSNDKPSDCKVTGVSIGHDTFQSFRMTFEVFRLEECSVLQIAHQDLQLQAQGQFLEYRQDIVGRLLEEADLLD